MRLAPSRHYDGYVGGVLLQGLDATGVNRIARVPASSICWDSDSPTRGLSWFGEVLNQSDSMGGWNSSGVLNHLDYTSLRYSINTGWLIPSIPTGQCNRVNPPSIHSCTVATTDHIYVDTIAR